LRGCGICPQPELDYVPCRACVCSAHLLGL
jgi:hypothetical protein